MHVVARNATNCNTLGHSLGIGWDSKKRKGLYYQQVLEIRQFKANNINGA